MCVSYVQVSCIYYQMMLITMIKYNHDCNINNMISAISIYNIYIYVYYTHIFDVHQGALPRIPVLEFFFESS